uniref:Uncharacterized protein n=1 Tax=Naja naja TaxID=35670 RepID=A0A8C7E3Q1_NAJNA
IGFLFFSAGPYMPAHSPEMAGKSTELAGRSCSNTCCQTRAVKISTDPSHPGHKLFQLLPSKRHYRALHTRTTRHKDSFFPKCHHSAK